MNAIKIEASISKKSLINGQTNTIRFKKLNIITNNSAQPHS